jgi:hypothetical protein
MTHNIVSKKSFTWLKKYRLNTLDVPLLTEFTKNVRNEFLRAQYRTRNTVILLYRFKSEHFCQYERMYLL